LQRVLERPGGDIVGQIAQDLSTNPCGFAGRASHGD